MEQMEGKRSTTNVERCKRRREKNAEKYKINDPLMKKQARLLLKSNKDAYKEHEKKEKRKKTSRNSQKNFCNRSPSFGPRAILDSNQYHGCKIKNYQKSGKVSPTKSIKAEK